MILVWFGVFSISGTKLPHYILPAYPAIAMFFGSFIDRWLARDGEFSRAWLRASWSVLIVVGIGMLVGGGIAISIYMPNEMHLLLIGIVPVIGGIVGFWAYETDRRHTASATLLVTAIGFMLSVLAWAAPQVSQYQTSPHIANWIREHATTEQPHVKSYQYFEESLVYYCRQQVKPLDSPQLVASYFDEKPHDAFLVTTRDAMETLKPNLPDDVVLLESMPRFVRHGDLVLLGRQARTASAEESPGKTRFR
jgi:4-amino-4-deoxy-L-arabinose transferase-like glycosyltransferase